LKVMPYTVNDSKEARKLIDLHVDGIITDIPDRL
ncbi:glycerophosphodiester phosphodiesterase family protein, partial [Staphylococcus epidermidis]